MLDKYRTPALKDPQAIADAVMANPALLRWPDRGRVKLLAVYLLTSAVFGAVIELVFHRWLRWAQDDSGGAAFLMFGFTWSFFAAGRLRPSRLLSDPLPELPENRVLAAYVASAPRVAALLFATFGLMSLVEWVVRIPLFPGF